MSQVATLPAAPPPPMWESVPHEMAQRKQWLLWSFELDPKRPTKKALKMPYYADGGKRYKEQGLPSDRRRLVSLADVQAVYEQGGYSGIGFAFLPGDGLIGIDIDGAIDPDTGEVSPRCQAIIEACDSFTELSPSGKGVHIFVLGHTTTAKSNDIGVEMFCESQFFTVTARRWPGTPADVVPIGPEILGRMHKTIADAKEASREAKYAEKGMAVPPPLPAPAVRLDGSANDFRKVNDVAMTAFHAWVPSLFPAAIKHGQGYRVTSKALGRDLQEDLAIDPRGIKDWGVADMGDAREGARSPVDLVMEWEPSVNGNNRAAMMWLAQRLGIEIQRTRPRLVQPGEGAAPEGRGESPDDHDEVPPASEPPPPPKKPPVGKQKRERRDPDWGKYEQVLEHFVLIYGTDMVWDGMSRRTMKIANMAHAHGSDIVRMWKQDPKRRTVNEEDVVFDPTETCDPDRCINLYNGFAMEPVPCTKADVQVMLDLLCHLCGNCATQGITIAEVMHWVLCWIALPLQRKGAKPRSALVFHGPQGTGKNLFFDVVRSIYGDYGIMVGQTELDDKFNGWLRSKLLVLGNEVVTRQELYHNKNKLKWVITEDKIPIRGMNQDSRQEDNYANVVFMSNESMPLVIEPGDRRYLVVYTPVAEDGTLYKRAADFLAGGGAAKWMHYLQHYDVGDFHEHTKPPMTSAKAELIELGMKPAERFMYEWLQRYVALPVHVCSAEQLYRAFRRWCDQAGERYPPARNVFTNSAKRWVTELVERNEEGKRKEPRLSYKVATQTTETGDRRSMRIWIPRGLGPPEGVTEGQWAADAIDAFEPSLTRFTRNYQEGRDEVPVSQGA